MTPPPQLRAIIWAAVSTKIQADEDKNSLETQEHDARVFLEKNNMRLIADPLVVPGHSRRYLDFQKLAADAKKQGINAFYQLQELIDQRAFDVVVVRDGDRFARTQALHAYITESVIDIGARIYSLQDGWIDQANYRMWISMSGYKAASAVDDLVRKRITGLKARAARHLPVRPPLSHVFERDSQTGKAIRIVLDHSKIPLLNDLAHLVLEGCSLANLAVPMRELGHINPKTGEGYGEHTLLRLLYNPTAWGHTAVFFNNRTQQHSTGHPGPWVWNEGYPAPAGVILYRNTHQSAWEGELATALKAELSRRAHIQGRARSRDTSPFRGIVFCGACGSGLSKRNLGKKGEYLRCDKWYEAKYHQRKSTCAMSQKAIRFDKVYRFLSLLFNNILEKDDWSVSAQPQSKKDSGHIALLQKQLQAMRLEAERLVSAIALSQHVDAIERLTTLLDKTYARISALEQEAKTAVASHQKMELSHKLQEQALDELRLLDSIDALWQRPSREINQFLHRVLGSTKIFLRDGELYVDVERFSSDLSG